jgi:hypothetical protein
MVSICALIARANFGNAASAGRSHRACPKCQSSKTTLRSNGIGVLHNTSGGPENHHAVFDYIAPCTHSTANKILFRICESSLFKGFQKENNGFAPQVDDVIQ